MGKKITLYNSNNHSFEANLLLCFEVPEIEEKYIVYSFPTIEDTVVINVGNIKQREDNNYYIEDLNNEEEWDFVKKVMFQIFKEERG